LRQLKLAQQNTRIEILQGEKNKEMMRRKAQEAPQKRTGKSCLRLSTDVMAETRPVDQ